jgi:hypothetical protein
MAAIPRRMSMADGSIDGVRKLQSKAKTAET